MKTLATKLSAQCGETLVETLAGMLICALAAVVLSVSIATATRLNAQAGETMVAIQDQQEAAALRDSSNGTYAGTVVFEDPFTGDKDSKSATFYGGDEVVAYELGDA